MYLVIDIPLFSTHKENHDCSPGSIIPVIAMLLLPSLPSLQSIPIPPLQ